MESKFYTKSWLMWLMLLLCAPIGIFLMWMYHPELKKNAKLVLSVISSIIFLVVIFGRGSVNNKVITIEGQELGEYGKEVVLNANTDLPTTKYLYKLPAGSYKVTTTFTKLAVFFIVKDGKQMTGSEEYPEELNYVGDQYGLTASNDDFNGLAKKSVEIKLESDESILINDKATFKFEKLS